MIFEYSCNVNLPTQTTANLRNPESDRKELVGFLLYSGERISTTLRSGESLNIAQEWQILRFISFA
jgi:hypothetical protein